MNCFARKKSKCSVHVHFKDCGEIIDASEGNSFTTLLYFTLICSYTCNEISKAMYFTQLRDFVLIAEKIAEDLDLIISSRDCKFTT